MATTIMPDPPGNASHPLDWNTRARKAMDDLTATREPFTADDLTARVGVPDPAHKANGRNSAVGALFREYRQRKLIEPIGTVNSLAPHRHGGLIRVWQATGADVSL
jgi:hypothetical protein